MPEFEPDKATLRQLFVQKAKIQQELHKIDDRIATLGRIYWRNRGYTMVFPRMEKLRIEIMGE